MIESQTTFIFKPMANNVCMGHFYHHHARKDIDMRFRYIIKVSFIFVVIRNI